MLNIYLTNLGRYNEGVLDGKWVELPITREKYLEILREIHIDGVRYEEMFITDYECDFADIDSFGEYESIDELNYLAELVCDMTEFEEKTFEAAQEMEGCRLSVKDMINIALNLDAYYLNTAIEDEWDLGKYFVDECGQEVPEWLERYIDYKKYGEVILEDGECALTSYGFIELIDRKIERYDGSREDIPDEYIVTVDTGEED